jgi:hypothetical protein
VKCSEGSSFKTILTHSLTHSWSWALLEKLPLVQPLKKFPAFYGTRRFIIVFTRALHWSLSWARSVQSIPSHPISLRSILYCQPTYVYLQLSESNKDLVLSPRWVPTEPSVVTLTLILTFDFDRPSHRKGSSSIVACIRCRENVYYRKVPYVTIWKKSNKDKNG